MTDRRMQLELRERVELERDRARLEFLVERSAEIFRSKRRYRVDFWTHCGETYNEGDWHYNWRDAIDEAMSNE
jgi:hypothetical protein